VNAEGPEHRVTLTKAFYLASTEVTFAQFEAFVNDSHCVTSAEKGAGGVRWDEKGKYERDARWNWKNPGRANYGKDHPALQISWNDAVEFCRWLSDREGLAYRLPTEAEWEYACRAGTETPWHSGAQAAGVENVAWGLFRDTLINSDYDLHPVGRKKPNGFGLFDMHGNAQEWCSDWYSKLAYAPEAIEDPAGPSQPDTEGNRVVRGGAIFWPHDLRSAIRRRAASDYADNGLGLRVVMTGNPHRARTGPGAAKAAKEESKK
jgi:formylglycine-generating enzyme required for sulfatase activity